MFTSNHYSTVVRRAAAATSQTRDGALLRKNELHLTHGPGVTFASGTQALRLGRDAQRSRQAGADGGLLIERARRMVSSKDM